jgi:hypothetical protein
VKIVCRPVDFDVKEGQHTESRDLLRSENDDMEEDHDMQFMQINNRRPAVEESSSDDDA